MELPKLKWLEILILVYILLVSVSLVGSGFKIAAIEHIDTLLALGNNPLACLLAGTLATVLVQSSSTVTSIVVGMVSGGLPLVLAVPLIMGANIGTTVTNTIVSLAHVRKPQEFNRAFVVATMHDIFNITLALMVFPIEVLFHPIQKLSLAVASLGFSTDFNIKDFNFVKTLTSVPVGAVKDFLKAAPTTDIQSGILMGILGVTLTFLSILIMGKRLRRLMKGRAQRIMKSALSGSHFKGVATGVLTTVAVQSSSTSTSLMVPLVGTGIIEIEEAYPFTLGANIGTCVTALIAAYSIDTELAMLAQAIALFHLFYNTTGVLLFSLIPVLKGFPVRMAKGITLRVNNRLPYALAYTLGVFLGIPSVLLGVASIF